MEVIILEVPTKIINIDIDRLHHPLCRGGAEYLFIIFSNGIPLETMALSPPRDDK